MNAIRKLEALGFKVEETGGGSSAMSLQVTPELDVAITDGAGQRAPTSRTRHFLVTLYDANGCLDANNCAPAFDDAAAMLNYVQSLIPLADYELGHFCKADCLRLAYEAHQIDDAAVRDELLSAIAGAIENADKAIEDALEEEDCDPEECDAGAWDDTFRGTFDGTEDAFSKGALAWLKERGL